MTDLAPFGRHLDSRPFGLGGKVCYLLRLEFYSEQFKRDAVALYENNEDLSLAAAAAERVKYFVCGAFGVSDL